jgi:hypothetical protein
MGNMIWPDIDIFTAGTRQRVEKCMHLAEEADVLVDYSLALWLEPDRKTSITR